MGSYNVNYEIMGLTKLDSRGSSVEVVLMKLHNNVDEEMEISGYCQSTIYQCQSLMSHKSLAKSLP